MGEAPLRHRDESRQPGPTRVDVVVLAASPWDDGGIARSTRTLLRALTDLHGEESVGVLPVWAGSGSVRLPGELLRTGCVRDGRQRVPLRARLAYLLDALRVVRHGPNPQILITTHAHLAPVAELASRLRGRRTVVCAHGDEVWGPLSRPVMASLRHADAIWAVSTFTADRLRAKDLDSATRIRVLPHAVSPEVRVSPGNDSTERPLVLSVATLDSARRYKGVDTLLRAWPRVQEHVPEAELLVIGEGNDRGRLEGIVSAHGVDHAVTFAGRVSDEHLAQAYEGATLFALPGRARLGPDPAGEGFGLVFIEAATAGLPIVAGRAGGATEAVRHGRTGLLVDPEDLRDVAAGIVRLLGDRSLAREMGARGRRWVTQRFSYGRFRADVARLIGEIDGTGSLRSGASQSAGGTPP